MKAGLVVGHVAFDVPKLGGLELLFTFVPSGIKHKTVRVQVRVGGKAFHGPGGLVDKVYPDQLARGPVIVGIVFANPRFTVGFNVQHGGLYTLLKGLEQVVVVGQSVQDRHRFGAVKINVVTRRSLLFGTGCQRFSRDGMGVLLAQRKEGLFRGPASDAYTLRQ